MRPSIDETWMAVALALSARGTCAKMQVGCVLADARGRFLAGNYNGVASGRRHCNEPLSGLDPTEYDDIQPARRHDALPFRCAGADAPPGSDLCEAVHAEQNALSRCRDVDAVRTCYTTTSPCMRCVKQLLNTGCSRIVFLDEYAREPQAAALWRSAGHVWARVDAGAEARLSGVAAALGLKPQKPYPTKSVG